MEQLVPAFVDALAREIEWAAQGAGGQRVHTIFFGGGTPSLLTARQFEHLLAELHRHFDITADAEITIEANPNDLDRGYLRSLRTLGINRLSIGMQSSDETELRLFDRRHDNEAVVRAGAAARSAGFDNLNLDLVYGAPHQTMTTWAATLRQALALAPEHISLYALGLEDGTSMQVWVERGKLPAPDDDLAADMYELATDMLGAAGYGQYEISNWAQPGRECRHNLQYWYNEPYLGLGPGAHGFAGGVRYSVILSPQRYIKALTEAATSPSGGWPRTPALAEAAVLERDDEIAETLIMWLRLTREGVGRARFAQRFGVDLVDLHRAIIERFRLQGLIEVDDERVRLTPAGRLLSNIIFREFV